MEGILNILLLISILSFSLFEKQLTHILFFLSSSMSSFFKLNMLLHPEHNKLILQLIIYNSSFNFLFSSIICLNSNFFLSRDLCADSLFLLFKSSFLLKYISFSFFDILFKSFLFSNINF